MKEKKLAKFINIFINKIGSFEVEQDKEYLKFDGQKYDLKNEVNVSKVLVGFSKKITGNLKSGYYSDVVDENFLELLV